MRAQRRRWRDGRRRNRAGGGLGGHLQTKVEGLVYYYRMLGHSIADLDPLDLLERANPLLSLKELGFEEKDLDLVVASRFFRDGKKMTLRELIKELEAIYCGTVGAEFMHIQNPKIRTWVLHRFEHRDPAIRLRADIHKDILRKLYEAETFENFLHTKYGGKRFSLEGGEALILALDTFVQNSEKRGVKELVMGMAHRGPPQRAGKRSQQAAGRDLQRIPGPLRAGFGGRQRRREIPPWLPQHADHRDRLRGRGASRREPEPSRGRGPGRAGQGPRAPACARGHGLPQEGDSRSSSTATRPSSARESSRKSSTCRSCPAIARAERSTSW